MVKNGFWIWLPPPYNECTPTHLWRVWVSPFHLPTNRPPPTHTGSWMMALLVGWTMLLLLLYPQDGWWLIQAWHPLRVTRVCLAIILWILSPLPHHHPHTMHRPHPTQPPTFSRNSLQSNGTPPGWPHWMSDSSSSLTLLLFYTIPLFAYLNAAATLLFFRYDF